MIWPVDRVSWAESKSKSVTFLSIDHFVDGMRSDIFEDGQLYWKIEEKCLKTLLK